MDTINISTLLENMSYYTKKAQEWAIFMYPTDTIYGLWGITTPEVIKKIDDIKQRKAGKFYSIIAPSFSRIWEHFEVWEYFEQEWSNLSKIHGPLTLLIPSKTSWELIGVRYLDHPFQSFVKALGQPFITTSANISWESSISSPTWLSTKQKSLIDFCIDDGILEGSGSTIIDYVSGEVIRGG